MDTLVIQESDIKRFRWLGDMLGTKFAKCSKCGAFMTDALEWTNSLKPVSDLRYSDDNSEVDLAEYAEAILCELTEYEPETDDIVELEEWDKRKEQLIYFFTNEDNQNIYITHSDVLIYKNKRCSCFKPLKKQKK